jgi:hypothetical protein
MFVSSSAQRPVLTMPSASIHSCIHCRQCSVSSTRSCQRLGLSYDWRRKRAWLHLRLARLAQTTLLFW